MIDISYMLERGILRPNSEQYNKFIDVAKKLKSKVIYILDCLAKIYGYEKCYVTKEDLNVYDDSYVKFAKYDNNGIIRTANVRIDGLNIYAKYFADAFASLMCALLKGKKILADSTTIDESVVIDNEEVLSMFRFELALEGIDLNEIIDR